MKFQKEAQMVKQAMMTLKAARKQFNTEPCDVCALISKKCCS